MNSRQSSAMCDEEFERVLQYGQFLGYDGMQQPQLIPVLREGLNAELPANWVVALGGVNNDEVYYYNAVTGVALNEHPNDRTYRRRCEVLLTGGQDFEPVETPASSPNRLGGGGPEATASSCTPACGASSAAAVNGGGGGSMVAPSESDSSSDEDNDGRRSRANHNSASPPAHHGEVDFEFCDNSEHPNNVAGYQVAPAQVMVTHTGHQNAPDVRDAVAAKVDADVKNFIAKLRQRNNNSGGGSTSSSGAPSLPLPSPQQHPSGYVPLPLSATTSTSAGPTPTPLTSMPSLHLQYAPLSSIQQPARPTSSRIKDATSIASLEQQLALLRSEKEQLEKKVVGTNNGLNGSVTEAVPVDFVCPITGDIMKDPVVTADGYTYERKAITKWFKKHNRSPCTNLELESKFMAPNLALKNQIQEYVARSQQQQ